MRSDRSGFEFVGEIDRILLRLDHLPVDHRIGHHITCPFEIADGDAAGETVLHRVDEFVVLERLDITLTLDANFLIIHGSGSIDRKDQFHIDLASPGLRHGGGDAREAHEHRERCKHRQPNLSYSSDTT